MNRSSKRRWPCRACGVLFALLAGATEAGAQVALPGVELPLPKVSSPIDIDVQDGKLRARVDARQLHVQQLLRRHPDRLTSDPRGEVIIRGELLAEPSTPEKLQQALAQGYRLRSESRFEPLQLSIAVLGPPPGTSLASALRMLRQLDPDGHYDYHHLLLESAESQSDAAASVSAAELPAVRSARPPALRVGMIDSGVLTTHPTLESTQVRTSGCEGRRVPSAHGTAVASLLVAALQATAGVDPAAEVGLVAADVYCDDPAGGAVAGVIGALALMAQEQVPVINVSLVGPSNTVLERVVGRMVARGHVLVAAVGNDGPAAPPLYPASYAGVVGVTAVDRRGRVLLEAGRGDAVDFAALGADLEAATLAGDPATVRGTSFAAPTVAGLLAGRMSKVGSAEAHSAIEALAAAAVDLGARGRDPVYGHGWVAPSRAVVQKHAQRVMSPAE